jgi:NADPH-dependent 2,4-dienoyl-CoA reductase/sulfur reductase-like enzyme
MQKTGWMMMARVAGVLGMTAFLAVGNPGGTVKAMSHVAAGAAGLKRDNALKHTDRSEAYKHLPVLKETDVVVAGGGVAGVSAAIAAARNGASTLHRRAWCW